MHCVNPPCVKLCPWGAARQQPNGISRIDTEMCLGGSKCKAVCPWDVPQQQTGCGLYLDLLPGLAGNGILNKCDRCYQRIALGGLPACIEACPEGVQQIGPHPEIGARAHALAGEIKGYIYGEEENGGTNTLYVSPVPMEQLRAAIETGPGRPHLHPVADTMAQANHLGMAMIIAPLAGATAAIVRGVRGARRMAAASTREQPRTRKGAIMTPAADADPISSFLRPAYLAVAGMLTLTGFTQMPIFKRYYIADFPGLGWLAAYFVTHWLHYTEAALLLGLLGYAAVGAAIHRHWPLKAGGNG